MPVDMVPKATFTTVIILPYAHALYAAAAEGQASQWRAESPAVVLAVLGEPLFQRSPEHYMSHQQTPFDHITAYAAVAPQREGSAGWHFLWGKGVITIKDSGSIARPFRKHSAKCFPCP